MKRVLLSSVFVLATLSMVAQSAFPDQPTILYSNQYYGGLNVNTQGWGGFFTYGKYENVSKITLFHADLQFVKHEKEVKRFSADPNARGYFYGKLNSFFVVHAGYGKKKILTEKLRRNGVQLSTNWMGGPSFGFTKPVYLEIFYTPTSINDNYIIKVEKYDPEKHFIDNIYGRASSLRGLGQMKFYPGVFLKWGFLVEYSNYRDGLKGIEVGAQLDAFSRKIPIMAERILEEQTERAKNHQVFLSAYINFFFGKKYNKV
ncbi:MAG: hypothetical protein R2809_11385 [Flavobacteriales bacterium]